MWASSSHALHRDSPSGRLVGQRASSHGWRYAYGRKGLLDEIPHVRLIRGVIIVRTEDAETATRFLEGMGAEVHIQMSALAKEDRVAPGV